MEQTLSRFLPSVMAARILKRWSADDSKLVAELPRMAAVGVERLRQQQSEDGSWGWVCGREADLWTTAYAAWGLALARENGVDVPASMLDRAGAILAYYVRNQVVMEFEDRAFAAFGAVKAGAPPEGLADILEREGAGAGPVGAVLAALACHAAGDAARAAGFLDRALAAARPDGNALFLIGKTDGRRWSDDRVMAQSFALLALVSIRPGDPRGEPLTEGLMALRSSGGWPGSTRSTALAVLALATRLEPPARLPDAVSVTVRSGDADLLTERVRKADLLQLVREVRLPNEAVSGLVPVTVEIEGGMELEALVVLKNLATGELLAPEPGAFRVERAFYRVVPGTQGAEQRIPLGSPCRVASGDLIEVELRFSAVGRGERCVLVDPRPAGCEPVMPREGVPDEGNWDRREIHDDHAAFLYTTVEGEWTVTHRIRAERPGLYHVFPAALFEMYDEARRGRSGEVLFEIAPRAPRAAEQVPMDRAALRRELIRTLLSEKEEAVAKDPYRVVRQLAALVDAEGLPEILPRYGEIVNRLGGEETDALTDALVPAIDWSNPGQVDLLLCEYLAWRVVDRVSLDDRPEIVRAIRDAVFRWIARERMPTFDTGLLPAVYHRCLMTSLRQRGGGGGGGSAARTVGPGRMGPALGAIGRGPEGERRRHVDPDDRGLLRRVVGAIYGL